MAPYTDIDSGYKIWKIRDITTCYGRKISKCFSTPDKKKEKMWKKAIIEVLKDKNIKEKYKNISFEAIYPFLPQSVIPS